MALQQDPIHTYAITAAGALTKWRAVGWNRQQAAAAAAIRGVAQFTAASGDQVTIADSGICLVEYGGTTTEGAQLEIDASGRFITKSAGIGVARCIDASTGAGYVGRAYLTGV